MEKVKLFEIHGERFAASAEGMEEQAVKPGHITKLAQTCSFVRGVILHHGRILTVIDLLQRVTHQKTDRGDNILVTELGGALFGFLIHADCGTLRKDEFLIKDIPLLAQSTLFHRAIIHKGEVVPLLDLARVMSLERAEEKATPRAGDTLLDDGGIASLFGRKDIDVVEFSLLGRTHALPRSEVKDILGFEPYRKIPGVPEIVLGVAAHQGEILPVLDLATAFGRRSSVTHAWRMLHFSSGDFGALVITNAVFGERRLPVTMQRNVPIMLPYQVVYGCYLDADSVRLILNVKALALHFEKVLTRQLLSALSDDMTQAPSEDRAAPQEPLAVLQPVQTEEVIPPPEMPAIVEARETTEPTSLEAEEAPKTEAISKFAQRPWEQTVSSATEETRAEQISIDSPQAEPEEHIDQLIQESHEEPEPSAEEETGKEEFNEDSVRTEETAAISEPAILAEESPPDVQKNEEIQAPPAEVVIKDEPQVEIEDVHEEPSDISHPEQEMVTDELREEEPAYSRPIAEDKDTTTSTKSSGHRFAYFTIGAILVFLIFIGVGYWQAQTGFDKREKQDTSTVGAVESGEKKPKANDIETKQRAPLVLTVPSDVMVKGDSYIVKKGDTLWDISKRFTKNPFNYPWIADENLIANPNLIYPKQKIIIKKKEK